MDRRLGQCAVLAGLAILTFGVRCLNYKGVFAGADVIFYGIDSYGHMRRIMLAVLHFPQVPTFDYFLNYPGGAEIPWPVGFDFLLAGGAWLLGGFGPPARYTLESICALATPVLGTLNVLLVYWLARRFFGQIEAILAAVALALFKSHVSISQIGRVDHHVVEPFVVPLIFLFFVAAVRSSDSREKMRRALYAGVATGASFLFWAGSTLFAALPGLFVLLSFALGRRRPGTQRGAEAAALLYAAGALLLLPAGLTSPHFRELSFTALALSWFQLLMLAIGAATCALLAAAGRSENRRRWNAFTGACVAGAGIVGALAFVSPVRLGGLWKGFSYLAAQDPLTAGSDEARRLAEIGTQGLSWAFTDLWMLVPPALIYLLWRHARRRFAEPEVTFLLLWFLTAALLSAGQFVRYYHHLALPLAIVLGIGLAAAYRGAGAAFERARGGGARAGALVLAAAVILLPVWLIRGRVNELRPTQVQNRAREFPFAQDAFEWLRRATPDPGGRLDPLEQPRYGVLAPWGYGFWLNYIAERPNIASPNILLPVEVKGARASLDVLLDEDESRAAALSEDLGARYVVATGIHPYFRYYAGLMGRSHEGLLDVVMENGKPAYVFEERYFRILNNRMLLFDGSDAPSLGVSGLGRFRLVYESPFSFPWGAVPQAKRIYLPNEEINRIKIFERVPGAEIAGNTVPLTPVRAEVTVRTNQGREFRYRTSSRSDGTGAFSVRLPYATRSSVELHETAAVGPYVIAGQRGRAEVRLTEAQIRAGKRLDVGALAGDGGVARKVGNDFDN
jgi:dolichyl-diphosphooligosaccharide--protein glycosyltransferase